MVEVVSGEEARKFFSDIGMDIASKDLSNVEVVKRWKAGKAVFSIELGGLGPGYEQAIQEMLFDVFSHLTEEKIPFASLVDGKKFSDAYGKICDVVAEGKGLSGAQYGAAKGVAYQFHRYGYKEMMEKVPQDGLILVDNRFFKNG